MIRARYKGERKAGMLALHRQKEITDIVQEKGFIQVSELSQLFGVSEVTIRSDLRALEQSGKLERKYGGAKLKEMDSAPFQNLTQMLSHNKRSIAAHAAQLIQEGESIFLDASSTTWHLALEVRKLNHISVISNSIPIFELFKDYTEGTVIGLPGTLSPLSQSFVGSLAEQTIGALRVSKAFISPKAILPEGLRDNSMAEATIRRQMMDSASETIVLADYSKFDNNRTLFGIHSFDSVGAVVTDRMPSESFRRLFEDKGIRLIVTDPSE
jgi:DeoR/GlpR family transcriptional regulator of sugar metabolism